MNYDNDPYMAAARQVAQSDDPRAEVLSLARLETSRRRRNHGIKLGSIAALLLVGVGAVCFALRDGPPTTDSEPRTALEDSRWMRDVRAKARDEEMSTADESRVRALLRSSSGLLRRGAVITLCHYGLEIDPAVLDELAFELTETIDHPVVVAARDGNHAAEALFANHEATLRAVARAIWFSCARTHTYPKMGTLERLLAHPDPEIRKSCYRALGEVHGYELSNELRVRLEADTDDVRGAARKILAKDKVPAKDKPVVVIDGRQ